MLLSKTGRYALMATIEIARRAGGDASNAATRATGPPVRASELASALDVPSNYLAKILHQLARARVLVSERGPNGGFRLAVAPEALPLEAVVLPVAPAVTESECLLGRPECRDADPCAAHTRWVEVSAALRRFLRDTTVADLIAREPAKRAARKRRPRRKEERHGR